MSETKKTEERHAFQAEVRQILDIVIHSLYTDREIFVRELVSNASDSLEKLRLSKLRNEEIVEPDKELEITITTDETARTITIADTGVGMTREELVEHLGTIAKSGTKAFLAKLGDGAERSESMIGQFGVGFYSVFMVADEVDVYTRSAAPDGEELKWTSNGRDGFAIEAAEGVGRGCRIVVHLREDMAEYSKTERIRGLLRKYSNFVPVPILLNGERVNTVEALWTKKKSEVSDEEYTEFYKFAAHAWDEPTYVMPFQADAPLEIRALLFVPGENHEHLGFGQLEAGVALYCRRVLIDPHPEGFLPEWMRFVRGVVDSSDLPLNISREAMQDSALVRKLGQVIQGRFVKFLAKQAKDDPEKYREFYKKFSRFLKEGIATDPEQQAALAGLLRFETSMTEPGELVSFADCIARAKEDQKEIYYLVGASREVIESGPYLEAFRERGLEVAFFTESADEFVLDALGEFDGRKLVAVNRAGIELEEKEIEGEALDEKETAGLAEWMKKTLGEKVTGVEAGRRLVGSPAAALVPGDAPNAHMRAMMRAMGQDAPEVVPSLEINPRHPLVRRLASLRAENPELAADVARQISDQAMLAAGLVDHPQQVASRMNELLARLLEERGK
jgi:molecular chaperone HtpG